MKNKFLQKTTEPDNYQQVYGYALALLNFRLRSEFELRARLKTKGFQDHLIDRLVNEFKSLKYLNDRDLAHNIVKNMSEYKSYGYYLIKLKLKAKGFSEEVIEQALNDEFNLEIEVRSLIRFFKKLNTKIETYPQKAKLINKLKLKGFRTEAVNRFLKNTSV